MQLKKKEKIFPFISIYGKTKYIIYFFSFSVNILTLDGKQILITSVAFTETLG